eukprot:COSAG01_NODE_50579_length_362_cov_0.764259_1_plen_33_part_01
MTVLYQILVFSRDTGVERERESVCVGGRITESA